MAIDASIYSQLQAPKFESPLNALAQVTQVRNAQNQNRLFDMKVAESERTLAGENALNDAYRGATGADGTIDRNKLYQSIASSGQGAKLPGIQKGLADTDKSTFDAQKSQLDAAGKNAEIVGQYMTAAKQNTALYPQILAQLRAMIPGGGKDLPDQFDPSVVDAIITRAMSVKDQIAAKQKELDYQLDQQKFGETVRNNKTQNGIAGANLGLRQQEVGLKREEVRSGGKAPSGYRFTSGGTLEAIPGGPADGKAGGMPKLTEDQGKATGWLVQAENAFGNMQAATKTNPNVSEAGFNDVIERLPFGVGENAANFLRGEDRQKFVQGASSLSEALLRAATGAGVNENEARQKIKELTPVPYDKPGVIKQKMEAIPLYIESLKVRAGPGASLAAGVSAKKPAASKDIHAEADAILRGK